MVGARLGYAGRYLDADDVMRLVQVRDLLAGQSWFDLHQYRIDPPHAPLMHWSRIVDAPLAGAILLLRPLLGQANAETGAAVLIPFLTLATIVFSMAGMAFRLFGRRTALLASLLWTTVALTMVQVRPLRIDHHGWQIAAVLVATSALLSTSRARGGWIAGLALAAGMSISLEVLPFAAAFGAVLALRWLIDREERYWFAHFLAALATGLVLLTLLTRGFGDGVVYCDVIGLPHLVFFGWMALATALIVRAASLPTLAAMGLVGLAGVVGLAAFLAIAPQCAGSPFGSLDPLVHDFWYLSVMEGQPIWKQDMPDSLGPLLQALVALGALVLIWRRAAGAERRFWLSYGLLFCASLATGLLVWRSMGFAGALSVLPLAWLADRLIEQVKARRGGPHAALRQAAVGLGGMVLLMPFAPIGLFHIGTPAHAAPVVPAPLLCNVDENAHLLNALPPTVVFAPLDIGPDILASTRHSVVATGHHRAQLAMHDVIRAFSAPPEQAHAIVLAHRAGLLAICTDLGETERYEAVAPHGLMAQLVHGQPPAWLQRVDVGGPDSFRVWRVVR
ncbi:MAG: hypothetical protein J2O44_02990 [Porphyrobacter sp.]|nr:hypothetical protein [Porphyrobacter sp.]